VKAPKTFSLLEFAMDMPRSADHFAHTLEQVCRHWETRRRQGAKKGITVALARQAGTHGNLIACEVGKRLGWPVYDRELLELIAKDMGLQTSLLESVDEKQISWLLDCIESLQNVPPVNEFTFVRHLVKTVLMLGSHGQCIIVGRGAAHFLAAETTLRVRLVAPLQDRITALAKHLRISRDEAARQIEITDRQRTDFVRHHFLKDPNDACNYDLVLNVARFIPEKCADIITAALQLWQAHGG
jgi:hypothetical protein